MTPEGRDDGDMRYFRSLLETGELDYARLHVDASRAEYFDDEFRIWIPSEEVLEEVVAGELWTPVSEHEVDSATEAWPGWVGLELDRLLA